MNTIAAIATPNMTSSIATIRISGSEAVQIAERIFVPMSGKSISSMTGYTACYGKIKDGKSELEQETQEIVDEGVLLVFKSPKSYTGEDVVEITCHGGVFVARRVLEACINAGAVPAEAGEFTKRAVLNGKMTLTQAESVIDVINSVSNQYLACSNAQRAGSLERKINEIADVILGVSSHIAAWLDYPDEMEDDSFEMCSHIGQLTNCRIQLSLLLKSYEVATVMREGVVTAIVGKPNAGKSTLMNLLTQRERSIVTDIPGTTRDIVTETININGAILRLCDCAGIRETDDEVEQIGIESMHRQIEEASLILAVFDSSRPLEKDDLDLIEKIKDKNCICVINKIDLPHKLDLLQLKFTQVVQISAKNTDYLEQLAKVINKVYDMNSLDLSAGFIANERQRACVMKAEELLKQAISGIEAGATLDATGFLLEGVLEELYRLSGKSVSAKIIDEVFKSFCVGK
jgi:tRNA modification GTPase